MTFALADFGHGTLTMDGVPALGSRELLVILVRYSTRMPDGSVDTPELPHEAKFYEDLVFANPFGSTPAGPIPYVRNVEHYYRAMSGGRFGWVKAGVVGPVVLSEDESKKDGGLRQRIVQIVRNRGLFNFSVYNVPGEARVAGKRNINAIIFENEPGASGQSDSWISLLNGEPSLTLAAHELMHEIGTPVDIYGYDTHFSSKFSLMGNSAGEDGDRSAFHADPWHKLRFGWIDPRIEECGPLSDSIRLVAPGLYDARGTCILCSQNRSENEYFILEFRNPKQAAGRQDLACYDTGTGGAGLALWHIVLQNDKLPRHFPGPDPNNPGLDWIGIYLDSDPAGNFDRRPGQMYDGFQAGGLTLWAGSTVTPSLRWSDGSSAGVRIAVADFPPDADTLDVRVFDENDDINVTRFWYSASSSQNLIVSSYGIAGNLEMVIPVHGRLQHYWRRSEPGHTEWHGPIAAAPPSSPHTGARPHGILSAKISGVSLIQSRFGNPGNLEAVVRVSGGVGGDSLAHVVRNGGVWSSPVPILVNGNKIDGVTGNPAFIQSAFGSNGNFELLVIAGKRLLHFFRDNDTAGYPWRGPFLVHDFSAPSSPQGGAALPAMTPIAVSLVQTRIGQHGQPGPLEAVVLVDRGLAATRLWVFRMGQSGWESPVAIATDSGPVGDATANPALLQSNYGQNGNLELVVPAGGSRLLHYWRDNDVPKKPWHGPILVLDQSGQGLQGTFGPIALIQNGVRYSGDLEVVARVTPPSGDTFLVSVVRDAGGWRANWPLTADGIPIRGVTGD